MRRARGRARSTTTSSSSPPRATPARPRSRASPTATHTRIVVFYPAEGVSDIQRKQMVTQRGDNVGVFGVRGNFDDCQNAVKAAFADEAFNAELHERARPAAVRANSINWGRLLPQIVYYVSAYADMVRRRRRARRASRWTCACRRATSATSWRAYYAREMGVPIGRLLCASNENKVLTDFIATGVYDISAREFVTTPSPEHGHPHLEQPRAAAVRADRRRRDACASWMAELARGQALPGRPRHVRARCASCFVGDFVTNDESLETIRRVWDEHGYLLDPHTAVAWEVAERLRGDDPVLVVSTAHWAKFGADVYKALDGHRRTPSRCPPEAAAAHRRRAARGAWPRCTGRRSPCRARWRSSTTLPERFTGVVDAGRDGVEDAVRGWLAG